MPFCRLPLGIALRSAGENLTALNNLITIDKTMMNSEDSNVWITMRKHMYSSHSTRRAKIMYLSVYMQV